MSARLRNFVYWLWHSDREMHREKLRVTKALRFGRFQNENLTQIYQKRDYYIHLPTKKWENCAEQNIPKHISRSKHLLTLSPPNTTVVPHANSLDLDETQISSASHPDPCCLTLDNIITNFGQHWSTLKVEADEKYSRWQSIWQAKGLIFCSIQVNSVEPDQTTYWRHVIHELFHFFSFHVLWPLYFATKGKTMFYSWFPSSFNEYDLHWRFHPGDSQYFLKVLEPNNFLIFNSLPSSDEFWWQLMKIVNNFDPEYAPKYYVVLHLRSKLLITQIT